MFASIASGVALVIGLLFGVPDEPIDISPVTKVVLPNPIFPIAEDKPNQNPTEDQLNTNQTPTTTQLDIDPILCSCITGLRSFGVLLPPKPVNAEDLESNTTPHNGAIILFSYPNSFHAALITFVFPGGVLIEETNYNKCKYSERFVEWNDPYIRGFYASTT